VVKEEGVSEIKLKSTRTSKGFYEKFGYTNQNGEKVMQTRGVEIECFDMEKVI
jgi:hypothetical protein